MHPVTLLKPQTPSDSSELTSLTERAIRGETQAIGALLKKLAPAMIRTVKVVVGPTHPDADDFVQQALIGFVQALPTFRNECPINNFANRVAARVAMTAKRRAGEKAQRRDDSVDMELMDSGAAPQSDAVNSQQRQAMVRELLETLPEEQAETLALRIVLGFSLEEVAAATGVPLNTVRSRVRLAKTALKKRIEADPRLAEALEVGE